jgi:hypothetical protein
MLHFVVEINHVLLKGLVDTKASMLVMVASVVKEFGIMHLVSRHETYKIALGMIIETLGRITNILVIVGKMVCQMVFLVNIDSYDLLFRLDFLMKIRTMVDVEKGVIHVKNGP